MFLWCADCPLGAALLDAVVDRPADFLVVTGHRPASGTPVIPGGGTPKRTFRCSEYRTFHLLPTQPAMTHWFRPWIGLSFKSRQPRSKQGESRWPLRATRIA